MYMTFLLPHSKIIRSVTFFSKESTDFFIPLNSLYEFFIFACHSDSRENCKAIIYMHNQHLLKSKKYKARAIKKNSHK